MSDNECQRIEVITGPARRRRLSTEQKPRIIEASYAPGASVSEVARRHRLSERAQLFPANGMHALDAVLDPVNVQRPAIKVVLIPAKLTELGCAQAVPERDEDHRRVAVTVPVLPGGGRELLHLTRCEVLTGVEHPIRLSLGNCPIFSVWGVAWSRNRCVVGTRTTLLSDL